MNNKKIIKIFIFILISLIMPFFVHAQDADTPSHSENFKAVVLEIVKQQKTQLSDGTFSEQQDVKVKGTEGKYKGKVIDVNSIGNYDVAQKNIYKKNDTVMVEASFDDKGNVQYFITDYVREKSILLLFIFFTISLLAVGKFKGFRSLISLFITVAVIMGYIVPQIIDGVDPVIVTIIGSFGILFAIIYLTEGFNTESNLAVAGIFISLVITVALSSLFVEMTKLSGVSSEEAGFLVSLGNNVINFKGLLLAGIIIGTLGVLDDIALAQVAAVGELYKADNYMSRKDLFKGAYRIGVTHINAMTNTLFLAYTGASLPLLILFSSEQSAFSSVWQVVNNESIATEIVRTLIGSIGLVLTVPISTGLAVWWHKRKRIS